MISFTRLFGQFNYVFVFYLCFRHFAISAIFCFFVFLFLMKIFFYSCFVFISSLNVCILDRLFNLMVIRCRWYSSAMQSIKFTSTSEPRMSLNCYFFSFFHLIVLCITIYRYRSLSHADVQKSMSSSGLISICIAPKQIGCELS